MSTLFSNVSVDQFFIHGKPSILDVFPYTININNSSSNLNPVILTGKSFIQLRNLYLSGSNPNILNGVTFFNPFSADNSLYPTNPGFSALQIIDFSYTEKNVYFDLPSLNSTGFLDILVENEAGYSILSRDSRVPGISSYPGWSPILNPAVSGIQLQTH